MYKWSVKITTKNGTVLNGVLKCEFADSGYVAENILLKRGPGITFNSMSTSDEKGQLLFNVSEIFAIEIRPWEG